MTVRVQLLLQLRSIFGFLQTKRGGGFFEFVYLLNKHIPPCGFCVYDQEGHLFVEGYWAAIQQQKYFPNSRKRLYATVIFSFMPLRKNIAGAWNNHERLGLEIFASIPQAAVFFSTPWNDFTGYDLRAYPPVSSSELKTTHTHTNIFLVVSHISHIIFVGFYL